MRAAWDLRLWRLEWCDRHRCHVTGSDARLTKYTYLRVVCLRLESNIVIYLGIFPVAVTGQDNWMPRQRRLQHMPDDIQWVSKIHGEKKCDARETNFHPWIRLIVINALDKNDL